MNITWVLLVITVSSVAHAATVRYDGKPTDSKKSQAQADFQATKPSVVETSSRSSQEDMHLAQMKMQTNQIENSRIHNNNKYGYQSEMPSSQAFHSQEQFATDSPVTQDFHRDQSMFHSQQPGVPVTTASALTSPQNDQFSSEFSYQPEAYNDQQTGLNQPQFYSVDQQQQFYNDKERVTEEQQFYSNKQQTADQEQFYNINDKQSQEQQFYGNNKQSQEPQFYGNNKQSQEPQFYNNNQRSQEQQFRNNKQEPSQEMFYNDNKQPPQEEQLLFTSMRADAVQDQRFNNNNKQFQGIPNQQRTQMPSGKHSTQIQTQGMVQLSAFDNREHPLVLPQGAVQSASVLVSGLKNLPLLPAMVYNAGPVPSTHAVAYSSDPLYKGASVRQHLQTPYVRYVYSHIL